jgi:23S rRNA pseudouridine1911/1915/1917 synthase
VLLAIARRCLELAEKSGLNRSPSRQRTSGCLVVAKNDEAHRELSRQFCRAHGRKIYLALVDGKLGKETGTIEEKSDLASIDNE